MFQALEKNPRPKHCIFASFLEASQVVSLSAAIKSSVGRYPICATLHKAGCQSLWSFLGETTSKLRTQILVSRYCFLIKDPGLLGEVAGSRAGQGA